MSLENCFETDITTRNSETFKRHSFFLNGITYIVGNISWVGGLLEDWMGS